MSAFERERVDPRLTERLDDRATDRVWQLVLASMAEALLAHEIHKPRAGLNA